jgi:hypothetical protein
MDSALPLPDRQRQGQLRFGFDCAWSWRKLLTRARQEVACEVWDARCAVGAEMTPELHLFINALEQSLQRRHELCEDFAATPSSILLAVLNAVAEAREIVQISEEPK